MRAFLLALPLALAATPAPAAVQDEEGSQNICLAIAHRWHGTNADAQRIRAVPVPDSFRRTFEGGGCARFSLIVSNLIDWHLAFGDEATTRVALAYLAADPAAAAPPPAAYRAALARAWPAGARVVRETLARRPDSGPERERRDRAMDADPRVRRLRQLVVAQSHYLFLARQYLRASEFYGSPALLAEARLYFGAARDGARPLYPAMPAARDPDLEVRNRLGVRPYESLDLADVEIRIAVQAARFSRDPADVDAAQLLVDTGFTPVLREAAGARARVDDFCNSGEGDGLDEIRAACREEDDFLRRFATFWRNQALVDLLKAADPAHYRERPYAARSATTAAVFVRRPPDEAAGEIPWPSLETVDIALAVLDPAWTEGMSNPNFTGPYEEQVALHAARAEAYARRAEAMPDEARDDMLGSAMAALVDAARLAPAAEHPGRFRQVATRFLALLPAYEAARRRSMEERYEPDQGVARRAAYFRTVLAALDRIAVGAAD